MNEKFGGLNNKPDDTKEKPDLYNEHMESFDVIRRVDSINDNNQDLSKNEKLANEIIEKIKDSSEYQDYENQEIKFDTLEEIINETESNLKDLDSSDEYVDKAQEILSKTISDLKNRVEDYRRNIVNMERLNKSASGFRMEPEVKRERMKNLDTTRRNNHNVIQDNLRMISRFPNVVNKKLGTSLKWKKFFNSNQIEDRDFVKKWAYTTAVGENFRKFIEKIESKKRAA